MKTMPLSLLHQPPSPDLQEFIENLKTTAAKHGYRPTELMDTIRRHKLKPAIEKLVCSGDIQSGLERLHQLGLLHLSIESAVLKFHKEFSEEARKCAEFRIRMVKEQKR